MSSTKLAFPADFQAALPGVSYARPQTDTLSVWSTIAGTKRRTSASSISSSGSASSTESDRARKRPLKRFRFAPALYDTPTVISAPTKMIKQWYSRRKSVELLDSSAPESILPQDWANYTLAYSEGRIDLTDPPRPPLGADLDEDERVLTRHWVPPRPRFERERQAVVHRLEVHNQHWSPRDDREADSLFKRAGLVKLVQETERAFDGANVTISIMDRDKFMVIQSTILRKFPDAPTVYERDETMCAHTIIRPDGSMIVLDAHCDWRFSTSDNIFLDSARFYAGVSILGSSGLPLGTLCVFDDAPRAEFSESDLARLKVFAGRVQDEIAAWHLERLQAKQRLMQQKFAKWSKSSQASKRRRSGVSAKFLAPLVESSTVDEEAEVEPELSESSEASSESEAEDDDTPASSVASDEALGALTIADRPSRALTTASRLIHEALGLELICLVAIVDGTPRVVTAYGASAPNLDSIVLRHRTLTAPLVYQSPTADELAQAGVEMPAGYVSAVVVRVVAPKSAVPYLLLGLTSDETRIIGSEDVEYFEAVAEEMPPFL